MTNDDARKEHEMHIEIIKHIVGAGFLPEEQRLEGEILLASDALHIRIEKLCDVIKMHDPDRDMVKLKKQVLLYLNLVTGGIDTFLMQHPEFNRKD